MSSSDPTEVNKRASDTHAVRTKPTEAKKSAGETRATGTKPLYETSKYKDAEYRMARCHCACFRKGHSTLEIHLRPAKDNSGRLVCGGCYDRAGQMGNCA